jgi:hypothetical protein
LWTPQCGWRNGSEEKGGVEAVLAEGRSLLARHAFAKFDSREAEQDRSEEEMKQETISEKRQDRALMCGRLSGGEDLRAELSKVGRALKTEREVPRKSPICARRQRLPRRTAREMRLLSDGLFVFGLSEMV